MLWQQVQQNRNPVLGDDESAGIDPASQQQPTAGGAEVAELTFRLCRITGSRRRRCAGSRRVPSRRPDRGAAADLDEV